jgi:hypothetical protein
VGTAPVGRTRQRCVEEHLGALNEPARPGAQRQWTSQQDAHVIAVAWTSAPAGHPRWPLRLLADKVVARGCADTISRETVRQSLNKTPSSPGQKSSGASPQCAPSLSRPGKTSWTWTKRPMIPAVPRATVPKRVSTCCRRPGSPGQPARYDYAYERTGTRNLFMLSAP